MTVLVADVGGTNTRIALIGEGRQISGLKRYENDLFPSFDDVLARYTSDHNLPHTLSGCCIAAAGPVTSTQAKLTNRCWTFDAADIAKTLSVGRVYLINDLAALGYCLPDLSADQVSVVRPPRGATQPNTQALVAGIGTGFNVCQVKTTRDGPVVLEAELGHACLPSSVSAALAEALGSQQAAAPFATNEDLFSGPGLSRLYHVLSDGDEKSGQQILTSYDLTIRDPAAITTELAARLLGLFTRELVFQYLPFGGLSFAGGVARGILGSAAQKVFLETLNAPGPFADHIALVPIKLITDDAAALFGAARYAHSVD
jgi:glucokinase